MPQNVHIDKEAHGPKLNDHTQMGVYLGTNSGMNCVYVMSTRKVVHSKIVTFDESKFLAGGTDAKILDGAILDVLEEYYATEWVSKVGFESIETQPPQKK